MSSQCMPRFRRTRLAIVIGLSTVALAGCSRDEQALDDALRNSAKQLPSGAELAAFARKQQILTLGKSWTNRDSVPADVRSALQREIDLAVSRDAELDGFVGEEGKNAGELQVAIWNYVERLGEFAVFAQRMPPTTPLRSPCWAPGPASDSAAKQAQIKLLEKAGHLLFRAGAIYGRQGKADSSTAIMTAAILDFFEARGNTAPTKAESEQTLEGGALYDAFRDYGYCALWLQRSDAQRDKPKSR